MSDRDLVDLAMLRGAVDQTSAANAYNAVLDAVGHNHSGTLYANAEQAVAPLLEIALTGPGWAANAALDALTEMIGSFQPAQSPDANRAVPDPDMQRRMRNQVARHQAVLTSLRDGQDEFGTAVRAGELLDELNIH